MTLNFISKKRSYRRYNQDVTIKATENSAKSKGIGIIFKNKSKERITKTGYLSIALTEDRLYFAERSGDDGYKASVNGAYTFRVNIIDESLYSWANDHKGSYPLEYDEDLNYFFIQFTEKP